MSSSNSNTKTITNSSFSSSSSFSISSKWKYDVFISFRGEDTRKNFTDHLHYNLNRQGIKTFKDDQELERGKTISHELIQAIQDSKFLLIVFSINYASSSWCLDELVKIYECMKSNDGHVVYPIFYDVDPSEVRKQTGRYGDAFKRYEREVSDEKVVKWRIVLSEIANLSGWHLQNRHESEFINDIVKIIARKTRTSSFRCRSSTKDFVGLDSRVQTIRNYLDLEGHSHDVRFIGICGMGGIGKTTLARVVFDEFSSQFEEDGSCFLADVREVHDKHGLLRLQEKFLSEILKEKHVSVDDCYEGIEEIRNRLCLKRVLLILDDVNQLIQLEMLVGNRDWFGAGSRIIITTRDEHLLKCHGVDVIHRAEGLDYNEAFELFCSKAFRHGNCYSDDKFLELTNHFLNHANGLPLALDVLASSLVGRSLDEWRSALDKLQEIPNAKILRKLQISFDGLEEIEKKIFLDIACFFEGEDKDHVMKVLGSCGFYPEIGIRELVDKSLVTILEDNRIWMHDLIQEMGREIVRRESQEPGKRSRLWSYQDVCDVLSHNTGSSQVEGIVLVSCHEEDGCLSTKAFTQMTKLRLLKLRNIQISDDIQFLSNELRYVEWYGYPFKSLPLAFQPVKLVELHMMCSSLEQFQRGMKPLKMLKVIDLSHSENLLKTPDFREVPNLENLNLEGCIRLQTIDESIGILKRLALLSLKDCRSLVRIPEGICKLKSLKTLILNGCSKLDRLPEKLQEISSLEKLDFGGIARTQQKSIKPLEFLFKLPLFLKKNWDPLAFMLPTLSALRSLRSLNLSDCNLKDGAIPKDLSCFPLLQTLNLSGNDFVSIPSSIQSLSKLEDLRFSNCKKLQSLPDLPSSVLYLSVDGCNSLVTFIPTSINRQYKFKDIRLPGCKRLQALPEHLSSYLYLSVEGCASVQTSTNPLNSSSKHHPVKFVNRLKLIEIEGHKNMEFSRLQGYLHFLLRHISSELGHFNPNSHLSMYFPAKSIPGFFNYHGHGSSLIISLPLHWHNNKWMGFAISAIFQSDNQSLSESITLSCDLHSCNANQTQQMFLGHHETEMSKGTSVTTDQLMFVFVPGSSVNSVNWWDSFSHFKVEFYSDRLKVKCCGIRIVYTQDVGELIQCNRGYENSDLVGSYSSGSKTKRSHDESCNHSQVGSDEVPIDESQVKRMRYG